MRLNTLINLKTVNYGELKHSLKSPSKVNIRFLFPGSYNPGRHAACREGALQRYVWSRAMTEAGSQNRAVLLPGGQIARNKVHNHQCDAHYHHCSRVNLQINQYNITL